MTFLGYRNDRSVRRRLLDRDLAAVRTRIGGRLLEVGAGRAGRRGRFVLPRERISSWISLDMSASRLPHVAGDVASAPFQSATFDTVLCLEVLEYAPDPPRALREIRRLLRPNGLLVLSTPFLHRWDATGDLWRWTPNGIRHLMDQAGLRIEHLQAQGGALATAANVLWQVVRTIDGVVGVPVKLFGPPLTELLFLSDGAVRRGWPLLETFSTGYLVLARNDDSD